MNHLVVFAVIFCPLNLWQIYSATRINSTSSVENVVENAALAVKPYVTDFNRNSRNMERNNSQTRPRSKCDHCSILSCIKSHCYILHKYRPIQPKADTSSANTKAHKKGKSGIFVNTVKNWLYCVSIGGGSTLLITFLANS